MDKYAEMDCSEHLKRLRELEEAVNRFVSWFESDLKENGPGPCGGFTARLDDAIAVRDNIRCKNRGMCEKLKHHNGKHNAEWY